MTKRHQEILALKRDILAVQLLEVAVVLINAIKEYAKKKGIILSEPNKVNMLLREAKELIDELEHIESQKLPSYCFDDRDPEELPEPLLDIEMSFIHFLSPHLPIIFSWNG